jgi:hypothetical protein
MASTNIARLGVVLGVDMAEFTAGIEQAIRENKKLSGTSEDRLHDYNAMENNLHVLLNHCLNDFNLKFDNLKSEIHLLK